MAMQKRNGGNALENHCFNLLINKNEHLFSILINLYGFRQNRWHKRGITLTPTAFGIAFETLFLNQTGALVIIYSDGSVLISHGGTEMGQGLHTKMIQVICS